MQRKHRQYMLIAVILLIAMGLAGCGLFKTPTQVNGTVKYTNGTLIADAIVVLDTQNATTGADGTFSFEKVPQGTYTVTVTLDNEVIYEDSVVIKGKVMTLNIECVYVLTPEKEAARVLPVNSVEVSSVYSSYVGANIIDGDLNTIAKRWVTTTSDPEAWAILSFAEPVTVDTAVIYSGNENPDDSMSDAYRVDTVVIEVQQGSEWVEVATVTENRAYRCIAEFPATTASSWRFRIVKANILTTGDNRARIFEIRLLQAL